MSPETKKHLTLLAKIAITLALLAGSLSFVQFDTLKDCLRNIRGAPLAFSALLLVLGGFAGAASWLCVLRVRWPTIRYRETAACHWSGMFFNSFLPSNVGGDVVKGYMVGRGRGQPGFVVISLLLDRALNLGLLTCIGLFALLIRLNQRVWAAALPVGLIALFLCSPALAKRLSKRMQRWPRTGIRGRLIPLLEPVFELMSTPRRFAQMLAAAGTSQFLKTWQNVFLCQALGLDIPTLCVWYVIPLFGVVSTLPVSIGGLGLRETVALHLSRPLGLDSTHLIAFSLAGHLMVVLVNLLGALPFIFSKRQR